MSEVQAEVKVSERITVVVDGKDRELFMSFALLNRLSALVGDPQNIEFISLDPGLREAVLEQTLAERDEKGKLIKEIKLDEIAISLHDVENVLDWVTEHVLNFTLATLNRVSQRQTRVKPQLSKLTASLIGLQNSNSEKSAA